MNEKLTPFQIVIFGILIFIIIAGVAVFALQKGKDSQSKISVEVWGTMPQSILDEFKKRINNAEWESLMINYTEIPEDEFEKKWIDAMAAGTGPDIVIIEDDMLIKHENKLFLIDHKFYTQKQYKDNFVESGEVLLREGGFLGFPFTIDPLVFYWNRTILNNEGVSMPPSYWDDFYALVPRLVRRDSALNISRAVIPFGEYQNVKNAKDILIALIKQAGNDVIVKNSESGTYESVFEESLGFTTSPASAAINYFVTFSNPSRDVYTWNKALPDSEQMFLSGDLAFYIGYASERDVLIQKNPNLNFEVAVLPQTKTTDIVEKKSTLGKMYFLAIPNRSSKISNAFSSISKMTEQESIRILSELTGLPSVRRDVAISTAGSSYMEAFNNSALFATPFLDPDRDLTDKIFKDMIDSIVSGNTSVSNAVNRAGAEIKNMLK